MMDDEDTSVFLNIGDIVSIRAESSRDGFLSSLGPLDDRCVVKPGTCDLRKPLRNFLDCYFRVCPIEGKSRLNSSEATRDCGAHLAPQLKHGAVIEEHPNANGFQKLDGSRVQYGQGIRLLHCRSNKFLTLAKDESSDALILCLKGDTDGESAFCIKSPGELREGHVSIGDNVILSTSDAAYDLGLAPFELDDQPECTQVIASSTADVGQSSWKMSLFVTNANRTNGILKSGDTVRIFHEAQEKFLTLDESGGELHVFLRTSGRETATSAKSSKGLWEVDIVDREPCDGSESRWSSQFRFRHLATGQFLAADVNDDDTDLGCKLVVSNEREAKSVFELEPSQITRDDDFVPQSTSVRIRHVRTSTWIHSTDIPVDEDEEKPIMMAIGCSKIRDDKETFAVNVVPDAEIRDLDFVNEASKELRNLVASLKEEDLNRERVKKATNLLRQICNFIASPDAASTETSLNRDRQKLVREQGIVLQLFEVLNVTFGEVRSDDGTPAGDVTDDVLLEQISHRTCEALYLTQENYRKNREYISDQCLKLEENMCCSSKTTETQRDLRNKILSGIDS